MLLSNSTSVINILGARASASSMALKDFEAEFIDVKAKVNALSARVESPENNGRTAMLYEGFKATTDDVFNKQTIYLQYVERL